MILEPAICADCGEISERLVRVDELGIPFWACKKCGVVHEDRSWYRYIGEARAVSVIETGEPKGMFVVDTGIEIIGIDNTSGNAQAEDFLDLRECLMWLVGKEEE